MTTLRRCAQGVRRPMLWTLVRSSFAAKRLHQQRHLSVPSWAAPLDTFARRHIGVGEKDEADMLQTIGVEDLSTMISRTIPTHLLVSAEDLQERAPLSETELLSEMRRLAEKNKVYRSYLGQGYFNCNMPEVIKRCVLENPGWYTQYTPYQAEISQGRMESLFNFQTMICELTGHGIANASLLDEATAAAEAMTMSYEIGRRKKTSFFVDENCNPSTIALLRSRAEPLHIEVEIGSVFDADFSAGQYCGVIFQYPNTYGAVDVYDDVCARAKQANTKVVCATDLLALTVLRAPAEFGVDIAIGSAQRFGVPLGYGGPHAAFMSTDVSNVRRMAGRVVGLTVGAAAREHGGSPVYRLALQTREQHIRRGKATSNVCTAQALLANISALYAVYHGPEGLTNIAQRVHGMTVALATAIEAGGHTIGSEHFFDTLLINLRGVTADEMVAAAAARMINIRKVGETSVTIALDETVTAADVAELSELFTGNAGMLLGEQPDRLSVSSHGRAPGFMAQEVFNKYHSETDMMRYLKYLENRDLSLTHDMIPLGSCTMKLNSATEMQGVTMPGFANIHPLAPPEQALGYHELFGELKEWLCDITGYDDMSLQPNSGAQGEYAGLRAIRAYHASRGESHRDVCLIPVSAHGTNPASAAMCGMTVVEVAVTPAGEIDFEDLRTKCTENSQRLAACMITYPSTYGVFDETVTDICDLIHEHGGQVYLDGANMNANVNLLRPGDCGSDVSHLNLHKTFCIPHGGGGPGMGPIGVKKHLSPFLPTHVHIDDEQRFSISGGPFGSSLISTISWAYLRMMGSDGLRRASQVAILNANYMVARLADHYSIRFVGRNGFCAHEFIIDAAKFKLSAGIEVTDIAKRLQDYGMHAPTMSWPVNNAMMIEPTESESKETLDRYCDALIQIRSEIADIESGKADKEDNMLKNAPHTLDMLMQPDWSHPYTQQEAAFPVDFVGRSKFWPTVSRANDIHGDKNVIATLAK